MNDLQALEKGVCTAPRCRQNVGTGDGIQWLAPDGTKHRYCWVCWMEKCKP